MAEQIKMTQTVGRWRLLIVLFSDMKALKQQRLKLNLHCRGEQRTTLEVCQKNCHLVLICGDQP